MTTARRSGAQDGEVTLLVLVCAVIAGALILTAGAITQVHLGRAHLRSLTDAAALTAAGSLDHEAYYAEGLSLPAPGDAAPGHGPSEAAEVEGVPLSDESVRESAAADVAVDAAGQTGPSGLESLRLTAPTGSPDGRTAEVTLHATVRPWLLPSAVASRAPAIDLTVTSRAREGLLLP